MRRNFPRAASRHPQRMPGLHCERLGERINPSGVCTCMGCAGVTVPDAVDEFCAIPPAPKTPFVEPPTSTWGPPMPEDANVPGFSSVPAANHTIYLDFNGHTTTGTNWNANFGTVITPAFDVDGNAADFSVDEQNRIRDIWRRVAEDFSPFNVNVTTVEPPVGDLIKSGGSDLRWGIRVAIGGASSDWYGNSAGGVAFLNSFNYSTDTPCYVFADTQGDNVKSIAEATSHEVGHTLGLSHDGRITPAEGYYYGHGSGATGWAPIMGVGYDRSLVQWSKGEYTSANQTQNDVTIITTGNGFGYRTDDHGNTNATATNLTGTTSVSASGLIASANDRDVFRFVAGAGSFSFNLDAYTDSPNLDLKAELYNAAGTLLSTSNPATSLSADFTMSLSAGTYFLHLFGTGYSGSGTGSPVDTGYTSYGSLGQYTAAITGVFGDAVANSVSGRISEDWNANGIAQANEPGIAGVTVYVDQNANATFDSGEPTAVSAADGVFLFGNLPSGTASIRALALTGYANAGPVGGAYSVTLPIAGGAVNRDFSQIRTAPAIYGRAFLDANLNSIADAGEPGLAGMTVFLDANANHLFDSGEVNQVTDGFGQYRFAVTAGTHRVQSLPGTGFSGTAPANNLQIVAVTTGPVQNVDFGLANQTFAAPALAGVPVINDGVSVQRSRVTSLTIPFTTLVGFEPDAFTLRRLSDNAVISSGGVSPQILVAATSTGGATVATLTFTGSTGSGTVNATSLADGVWELRIDAAKVGNTAGPLPADYYGPTTGAARLHRLFGDSNADGTVDGNDFNAFGNAFNTISIVFDNNNDGIIGGDDLSLFGNRFGQSL